MIEGTGASPGIGIGTAFVRTRKQYHDEIFEGPVTDTDLEILKFRSAVNQAIDDVESLIRKSRGSITDMERDMLEMHIEMLSDPQLSSDVVSLINKERHHALAAVLIVSEQLIKVLGDLDSEYLRTRAADVRACAEQIIGNLHGEQVDFLTEIPAGSVIVADDISPVEALSMNFDHIKGIVTRMGGATSHTAILAKARNIPAVVGCGEHINGILPGATVIADGSGGKVWVNPEESTVNTLRLSQAALDEDRLMLLSQTSQIAKTTDGREIRLLANISGPHDVADAINCGAEGVGLFRTELLFMTHGSFPTEEEQYQYYRKVAEAADGRPVTIRTLDIGGDKPLPYLSLPDEENPFLGFRAIRISLRQSDRFIEQLKAILRAGVYGKLRVMFPMITGLQELRQAKELLQEARRQLREQGLPFDADMPVGVMIETPSAAILADRFAKEVDFFSIGTNDLCQYTLAVDRGNEHVSSLYEPLHPSVLRLIANAIEQAVLHKIDVSVCGELGGDPRAALLLVGMGLCSFSMTASSIPMVKRAIMNGSHMRALQIASDVMDMDDTDHIKEYLNEEVLNRRI